jgi:hypothetical protein
MTAPTPHTMERLVAVSSDMAELLAVATLHETTLGSVCLYSTIQQSLISLNILWDFDIIHEVIRMS